MPLRDDLLNPIPGENLNGENLRQAPVFDRIKEARREDDDATRRRRACAWDAAAKRLRSLE
jgi:type VI secretion system protein ImpA